jgi:hypothetical protein
MNTNKFVAGLVESVHNAAIGDVLADLRNGPPGRRPPQESVELSRGYQAMGPHERQLVDRAVRHAVHAALVGVLCVLDGVRKIDDSGGRLELSFLSENAQGVVLNSAQHDLLHDTYQKLVYSDVFGPSV